MGLLRLPAAGVTSNDPDKVAQSIPFRTNPFRHSDLSDRRDSEVNVGCVIARTGRMSPVRCGFVIVPSSRSRTPQAYAARNGNLLDRVLTETGKPGEASRTRSLSIIR